VDEVIVDNLIHFGNRGGQKERTLLNRKAQQEEAEP